jgi:hypothetical protein
LPTQITVEGLKADIFRTLPIPGTDRTGVTSMADLQRWANVGQTSREAVDVALDAILGVEAKGSTLRQAPKEAKGMNPADVDRVRAQLLAEFDARVAVELDLIAQSASLKAQYKGKGKTEELAAAVAKLRGEMLRAATLDAKAKAKARKEAEDVTAANEGNEPEGDQPEGNEPEGAEAA